jgi:hypothetical protein
MKKLTAALLGLIGIASAPALAQGSLSIALQQQMAYTNCAAFTNSCGTPLSGGFLYFYQVGTVGTIQQSFQDTGLTLVNPWPLVLDSNGRIPNFYLANGSVHVRLTDANGVVQFDIPSMLVVGASSGSGGGGSVDPTTIASTGAIQMRLTSEFLPGWVKLNGQTIGSATSGATQRANADTQALFVYEWTNCPDAHCPVLGGRGASGLADFNANKQITLFDMRGRGLAGLDDMGNSAAGRIFAQNVTSGGGDTVTTPNATGGEARHTLLLAELAAHNHGVFLTDPGHNHTEQGCNVGLGQCTNPSGAVETGQASNPNASTTASTTTTNTTGVTVNDGAGHNNATAINGSGTPFNNMQPFMLVTVYMKL